LSGRLARSGLPLCRFDRDFPRDSASLDRWETRESAGAVAFGPFPPKSLSGPISAVQNSRIGVLGPRRWLAPSEGPLTRPPRVPCRR